MFDIIVPVVPLLLGLVIGGKLMSATTHTEHPVMDKNELVQKAQMAKQAQGYDIMAACVKSLTEQGAELSNEVRNCLSISYKNVIRAHRSSWRVFSNVEQKTEVL